MKNITLGLLFFLMLLGFAYGAAAENNKVDRLEQRGVTKPVARAIAPVPAGMQVLYYITGVRNNYPDNTIATTINCTNVGSDDIGVFFEVYSYTSTGRWYESVTLFSGLTYTIATNNTAVFVEDAFFGNDSEIGQGLIRILVDKGKTDLVCSAHFLDAENFKPSFITTLPVYRVEGNKVVVVPLY